MPQELLKKPIAVWRGHPLIVWQKKGIPSFVRMKARLPWHRSSENFLGRLAAGPPSERQPVCGSWDSGIAFAFSAEELPAGRRLQWFFRLPDSNVQRTRFFPNRIHGMDLCNLSLRGPAWVPQLTVVTEPLSRVSIFFKETVMVWPNYGAQFLLACTFLLVTLWSLPPLESMLCF